jgi:hypothetical protein
MIVIESRPWKEFCPLLVTVPILDLLMVADLPYRPASQASDGNDS